MHQRARSTRAGALRGRLAWPLWLLLAGACQQGPEAGESVAVGSAEEALLRRLGEETVLTAQRGSLAVGPTASQAERVAALADLLRRERALFGGEEIDPAELDFLQALPEEVSAAAEGPEESVMLLHQFHAGAAVIDHQVVGIWSWREGGPVLRAVRGSLVEVAGLPRPAPLDESAREAVRERFADWLEERGEEAEIVTFMEHPVVHARERLAGYFAINTRTLGEDGSLATTAVLIDPASGALTVVAHTHADLPRAPAPTRKEEVQ